MCLFRRNVILMDLMDNGSSICCSPFSGYEHYRRHVYRQQHADGAKEALRSYISSLFVSVRTTEVYAAFQLPHHVSLMVLGIPFIDARWRQGRGSTALNLGAGGLVAILFCVFLPNLLYPCTLKAGVGPPQCHKRVQGRHIPKTPADKLMMSARCCSACSVSRRIAHRRSRSVAAGPVADQDHLTEPPGRRPRWNAGEFFASSRYGVVQAPEMLYNHLASFYLLAV